MLMTVSEGKNKGSKGKVVLEEIKKLTELMIDLSPHIEEAQQIPSRSNKKKYSRHTAMESQNSEDKEEILQIIKKHHITYKN